MNFTQKNQFMRNKALLFSRTEGGSLQKLDLDIYEDQLSEYDGKAEKKEVFSKAIGIKINTRVIKFEKIYIHALFFEDGRVYDCNEIGFRERKDYNEVEWINKIAQEKANV